MFRIAVDGGESEQVTDSKSDIGEYHLSPNDKWVAFTAAPERPELDTAKKLKMDFRVVDEDPADQSLYLVATANDSSSSHAAKKQHFPIQK